MKRLLQLVFSLLAVAALMSVSAVSADAAPTPNSGPTSGGTNVTIEGIHFTQVALGRLHSLGLTSEGTVYSWGANSDGQLGDGTTNNSSLPVLVKGVGGNGHLSGVTSISAGLYFSMALTPSGVFVWGSNQDGQLGDGTITSSSTPVQVKGVGGNGVLQNVQTIAAGEDFSLAATSTGVFAWGLNSWGQLGDGTTTSSSTPVQVKGVGGSGFLTGITALAGGGTHSLALSATGVFAWGTNYHGELGNNSNTGSSVPVQVFGVAGGLLTQVSAIAAGYGHSLAVVPSGVVAWGDNYYGQLGDGTVIERWEPVEVQGVGGTGSLPSALKIAAANYSSIAEVSSGVVTWGDNDNGQLCNGTSGNSATSAPVRALTAGSGAGTYLTDVSAIASGGRNTAAVTKTGIVSCGSNQAGELGVGAITFPATSAVIGPNFQPINVQVGAGSAIAPTVSGNSWSFVTPAGSPGPVNITATSALFGGSVAASPATVSWNAGLFTYVAPPALAETGFELSVSLLAGSLCALLVGFELLWIRRLRAPMGMKR